MPAPLSPSQPEMNDFDTGPLSWVMKEIREALLRSRGLLEEALPQSPEAQATGLRQARSFLHQAHGALQIVDIDGVELLTDAMERLLDQALESQPPLSQASVATYGEAATAIVEYLEELLWGAAHQPVRLFPYYKAVQQACGHDKAHPSDLFFPNLAIRPQLAGEQQGSPLDFQALRQRFERALLPFMRGTQAEALRQAATEMAALVAQVERSQSNPDARRFWWVLRGFAEGVALGEIAPELHVRQLFGRINLQLRRLAQGDTAPVERLLRDALFFVAAAQNPSGRTAQVQGAYQLAGQVPADYERRRYGQIDQAALSEARERLNQAKNLWMRLASGETAVAAEFEKQMQALAEAGARLRTPALEKLLRELNGIARAAHTQAGESLALEMASSLLFVESALQHASRLSESFASRAEALTARLLWVVAGEKPDGSTQWLDEMSRDAQQKETVAVLAGEMRTSLNQVEKGLEEFFGDGSKRASLAAVDQTLYQIEGALAILDQDDAARAIADTRHAVAALQALPGEESASPPEAQRVARNLGALSFFLETLQTHPASAGERFAWDEDSRSFAARAADPVPQSALEVVVDPLPDPEPASQSDPRSDPQPSQGASAASTAVPAADAPANETDSTPAPIPAFQSALEVESAPVMAPQANSASDDEVDAELLEIFLGEAEEVLACVHQTLPQLAHLPGSSEHLTTVRRSFHTLKGSGRMVGLQEFGEAAWSIEQVLNLLLADAKPANHEVQQLLQAAAQLLQAWVAELRASGSSGRSAEALVAAARRVRDGEAFHLEAEDTALPAVPAHRELPQLTAAEPVHEPIPGAQDAGLDIDAQEEISPAAQVPQLEAPLPSLDLSDLPPSSPASDTPALPAQPVEEAVAFDLDGEVAEPALAPTVAEVIDLAAVRSTPEPRVDDNLKRIGTLEISLPLYNIYLAETDDLVRLLGQDLDEWRHEPDRPVNTSAVHAAHSLSGSSATVGFEAVHQLAHALEMMLQALARRPVHLLGSDFLLMQETVARMKELLALFARGELPDADTTLAAALEGRLADLALRPGLFDHHEDADPADQASASAPVQALQAVPETLAMPATPLPQDELDADLLPVFLEEGGEILPAIGRTLRAWQQEPANAAHPASLLRLLHTVKGSARMAGAMALGQHLHDMESRIEQLAHQDAPSAEAMEELANRLETAQVMFERLQSPQDAAAQAALPATAARGAPADAPAQSHLPALPVAGPSHALAEAEGHALAKAGPGSAMPLVRVRADVLDRLVNQAGEVSIARSRAETEIEGLRHSLTELTENVARLRGQLREIEIQAESQMASQMASASEREFDPLEFDRFTRLQELTRMMAESVDDVASLQGSLTRTLDNTGSALGNQARLTRELQQDLMRVRMVQFGSISERLYRVTRQAAKETDKRVNLDLRGASVELDRGVLEKMAGPFEHLLRNAVVHGIESRAERMAAGKSETGEIQVEVRQEGNEIVLQFADDGRGLDLERIAGKARQLGLLAEGEEAAESELRELIFHPGFTTAEQVTALAGRGVGMDAVRSEAAALGGRMEVHSEAGRGARFLVRLPLTLAITQVVLLSAGGRIYAVPSVLVEQVQQLKANALAAAYNDNGVAWLGQKVGLHYLPSLLGQAGAVPVTQQYSPVVIMKSGQERIAVHVDEVVGNREVVVKNIGPQLSRLAGIAGATVLGSGEIVLIINPVPLAARGADPAQRAPRLLASEAPQDMGAVAELKNAASTPVAGLRSQPVVMVVDDSLTVRRVTQRLLTRDAYQVVLAKDGVEALEQLQAITPDVMLVDIEMPRMDGFDLTRNVRSDVRTRDIPIIMITSRTAEKHRSVAFELGVNEYLGKPYQEEQLLGLVKGFVAAKAAV